MEIDNIPNSEPVEREVFDITFTEVTEETPAFGESLPVVQTEQVFIETGRGNAVPVTIGSPFVPTIADIANHANYGRNFRVFLNGSEILNPSEAPEVIQANHRIVLTPYDKVG